MDGKDHKIIAVLQKDARAPERNLDKANLKVFGQDLIEAAREGEWR
ncbi:hypothetical protein ES706_00011 [subsurface metagenome]|nr:hypothetical protein [Hadesarchaea archaeon]